MTRFNTPDVKSTGKSPVKTTGKKTKTHEGGVGYLRDEKSELFLLAITNFHGQKTFYESTSDRDIRYVNLIHKVAVSDPEWLVGMLTWLRGPEGNMRTASLVGAAEFVKARLDAKKTGDLQPDDQRAQLEGGGLNRKAIAAVLQRADEPGELLAYWTSTYGRDIPKPVKRGIADAVKRLYTEYSLLKYDTAKSGFRFGDVLALVHPKADPAKASQGDLFQFAIDRRYGRGDNIPDSLKMVQARDSFTAMIADRPSALFDSDFIAQAGMTWENVSSLAGASDKKKMWEAVLPNMGLMAQIRNLSNLDEAGVSDKAAKKLLDRLQDPAEIAKSRQFPYRFYSAYKAAPSLRWGHALDVALGHSMQNLPEFSGKTLILIDTSGSMSGCNYSEKSIIRYVDNAALFGIALALRNPGADLYGFADREFSHKVSRGGSVLKEMDKFTRRIGEVGHGTDIAGAVRRQYKNHDRVIILTDMQTFGTSFWGDSWGTGDVDNAAPKNIPIYGFNLAGYNTSAIPSGTGNRHELGGVTDATFKMIPLLEKGRSANWPWL